MQHPDVNLDINKTEIISKHTLTSDHNELINTMKVSVPAADNFLDDSPQINNYFLKKQTEMFVVLLLNTHLLNCFMENKQTSP